MQSHKKMNIPSGLSLSLLLFCIILVQCFPDDRDTEVQCSLQHTFCPVLWHILSLDYSASNGCWFLSFISLICFKTLYLPSSCVWNCLSLMNMRQAPNLFTGLWMVWTPLGVPTYYASSIIWTLSSPQTTNHSSLTSWLHTVQPTPCDTLSKGSNSHHALAHLMTQPAKSVMSP